MTLGVYSSLTNTLDGCFRCHLFHFGKSIQKKIDGINIIKTKYHNLLHKLKVRFDISKLTELRN